MRIGNINLGISDQKISSIALGTMYMGSKINMNVSFEILNAYFDYGGSFLDSANKYASWIPGCNGGESEHTIGRWLKRKNNRHELFITSKVGFAYGDVPRSLKKEIIVSECEKSLKRMQTETIDLYFAHTYNTETPAEETMEAFYQLKKAGKIRFAGASNMFGWRLYEYNQAANVQGWEGFTCLQQRYSYLQPTIDADFGTQMLHTREIIDLCKSRNISIMAYSPLLSGFYSEGSKTISPYYESKSSEVKLKVLRSVAKELNVSPNAVVLAWMLQSSPAIIPVVACSSVNQLHENMQVLGFQLTESQKELLNQSIEKPLTYS